MPVLSFEITLYYHLLTIKKIHPRERHIPRFKPVSNTKPGIIWRIVEIFNVTGNTRSPKNNELTAPPKAQKKAI